MAGGCGAWPRQDIATIAITTAITALVFNVTFIGPPQLVKLHGPEEGYEHLRPGLAGSGGNFHFRW